MMHEYFVELRIIGEDLDPSAITKELGLPPSTVRNVGDIIGRGPVVRAEWGFNGAGSDKPPIWESLEDGLAFVLAGLAPARPKLEEYRSRFDMVWWCGHFQSSFDGGPTLSPSILKRLAEFGVPLYIDNYLSESSNEETSLSQQ